MARLDSADPARDSEKWGNTGIDFPGSPILVLTGSCSLGVSVPTQTLPPRPCADWRDLRTMIRDMYILTSPCYPSITYDKRTSGNNNSTTDRSHHEIKSTVFYLSF